MISETFLAKLGTRHPEDNPVLEGSVPPLAGRARPLTDEAGEPLLPRIVRSLKDEAVQPAPAAQLDANGRTRSVVDAGAPYPAVDHELLEAYIRRGRRLQSQALGELLGTAFLATGSAASRILKWLAKALIPSAGGKPAVTDLERLQDIGRKGILDLPADYEARRSWFYGRGL